MIFNIPLFQWNLFQTFEKELVSSGYSFRAYPSTVPSTNLFASVIQTNVQSYVRFIHSIYRVDVDSDVYYLLNGWITVGKVTTEVLQP